MACMEAPTALLSVPHAGLLAVTALSATYYEPCALPDLVTGPPSCVQAFLTQYGRTCTHMSWGDLLPGEFTTERWVTRRLLAMVPTDTWPPAPRQTPVPALASSKLTIFGQKPPNFRPGQIGPGGFQG